MSTLLPSIYQVYNKMEVYLIINNALVTLENFNIGTEIFISEPKIYRKHRTSDFEIAYLQTANGFSIFLSSICGNLNCFCSLMALLLRPFFNCLLLIPVILLTSLSSLYFLVSSPVTRFVITLFLLSCCYADFL